MTKTSISSTDLKALFKPPTSLLRSWAKRNSTLTESLGGKYIYMCVYDYSYKYPNIKFKKKNSKIVRRVWNKSV